MPSPLVKRHSSAVQSGMSALRRVTQAFALLAWLFTVGYAFGPTFGLAEEVSEDLVLVTIHARQFDPPVIILHTRHKTHLVLRNEDAELHAFVPHELFVGVSLNVGGNGAPEFDETGFKKVIIPSGGRADIRFVPERTGEYQFVCDMPGHEMRGTIRVE
ncbi:MAG TPA: cupredoxin domain-containing protein [Nitrospiraceae bacterium]|nr:cupredoxin domain-containing protein [Nitrospiraceae bacterium]